MAKIDSIDKFLETARISQEDVMALYRQKGFVKSLDEEQSLHMSFSPYRVPTGLSKASVRRRINDYKAGRRKAPSLKSVLGHRLTIHLDGKFFAGISVKNDVTKTPKSWLKFLKEYVAILESPRVPFKDKL